MPFQVPQFVQGHIVLGVGAHRFENVLDVDVGGPGSGPGMMVPP